MRTPLALQTLCFMKIADKFERFSPDAITAQLPPTQRSMLLLWLPVLDITKLEDTSVVRGIDMNTVWEKLCTQRLIVPAGVDYPFNTSIFHSEGSWKVYYLTIVTLILLNPFEADRHSRFQSMNFIANMLLSYHFSYLNFIPNRYDELQYTYFEECGADDATWNIASLLMEECHFKPKIICISSSLFFCSPFYFTRAFSEESRKILREFLSDTQVIVFSSHDKVIERWNPDNNCEYLEDTFSCRKDNICSHVMETILCSSSPKLESVYIDDKCPPLHAELIISTVGDICGNKYHWSTIKDENLHNNIPYKYLKGIYISMDTWKVSDEMSYDSAPRLTSAIKTQTSLEVVQFKRWPRSLCWQDAEHPGYYRKKEFVQLFHVLISLFKQPQFQMLELKSNSIIHSILRDILHTFFTVLSPNHQTLKLESVTIIQEPQDDTIPDVMLDFSDALIYKSLHLSNMELTPSEETLIFSYPLLKLESLALINLTSIPRSKSLERAADLLHMNKISLLKTLILKDIIMCHFHPQDIVSLLLQSPNLNHVEIEHVDIGPGGLLPSLPHEISQLKELDVLKLVRLDLGKQSEGLFHQLCVAILSLPRVSTLTLDLSSNELSLHHVTVILDTWKHVCSGKKLQELVLSGNNLELGSLPLANIAQQFVY